MTRDDIIRMLESEWRDRLEAAVAAEREECAKLVEQFNGYSHRYSNHLTNCVFAIRARGEK